MTPVATCSVALATGESAPLRAGSAVGDGAAMAGVVKLTATDWDDAPIAPTAATETLKFVAGVSPAACPHRRRRRRRCD